MLGRCAASVGPGGPVLTRVELPRSGLACGRWRATVGPCFGLPRRANLATACDNVLEHLRRIRYWATLVRRLRRTRHSAMPPGVNGSSPGHGTDDSHLVGAAATSGEFSAIPGPRRPGPGSQNATPSRTPRRPRPSPVAAGGQEIADLKRALSAHNCSILAKYHGNASTLSRLCFMIFCAVKQISV